MSKYAHIPQQKILPVDLGQNPPTIIIANAASVAFAPSSLWTFSPTQLCLMPLLSFTSTTIHGKPTGCLCVKASHKSFHQRQPPLIFSDHRFAGETVHFPLKPNILAINLFSA